MRISFLTFLLPVCLVSCALIHQPDLASIPTTTEKPILLRATVTSSPYSSSTSTATNQPSNTPFGTSTPTRTTTVIATSTETLTPTAFPPRVYLGPTNHQWQSINNCHRASIAILMGYYGFWFDQDDYDVAMDNLADFVSTYGLTARIYAIRYAQVPPSYAVRWLLAEGVPVIAGQKLSIEDNTWHYRVVHGYNDLTQSFTIDDPLLGNIEMSYETFDRLARGDGQVIPVYPVEKDEVIAETMSGWQMKLIKYPN
jgi:hypothetical protein